MEKVFLVKKGQEAKPVNLLVLSLERAFEANRCRQSIQQKDLRKSSKCYDVLNVQSEKCFLIDR